MPADTRPTGSYQRNKRRLGRQPGAKVAQIDIARKLTKAIWHMLTHIETDRLGRGVRRAGGGTGRVRRARTLSRSSAAVRRS
jgi:hypothetical protein